MSHSEPGMPRHKTQPPARRASRRPPGPVQIVLAGLDARTEAALRAAVGDIGTFSLEVFADLWLARAHVEQSADTAAILITDMAQLRRRLLFAPSVHVMAISGPDSAARDAVVADEILSQPLERKELVTRLRLAARLLAGRGSQGAPTAVLREALSAGRTGEVIVRAEGDDEIARIHVQSGRVGWVHRFRHRISMRAMLSEEGVSLDDETAREVMSESRRTRRHFADVLIALKIVDPQTLRRCLQRTIANELELVLQWSGTKATFVRDDRRVVNELAFDEAELRVPERNARRIRTEPGFPAVSTEPPPNHAPTVDRWLECAAALEAVTGCALLDAKSGHTLGSRGLTPERETIAWRMVAALSALASADGEVMAVDRTSGYIVRSALPCVAAVAVLCFDPAKVSAAMARIHILKALRDAGGLSECDVASPSGGASDS